MTGSRDARGWIRTGFFLLPFAAGPAAMGQQPPAAPGESHLIPVLEFPGGTVLEYVENLGRLRRDLNIILRPQARDVQLPPFSLKQVSAETAIQLLEAVGRTARGSLTTSLVGQENSIWLVDLVESAPMLAASGAGVPSLFGGGQPGGPTAPMLPVRPDRVRIFSTALLMASQVKPETILTAVETALQMLPDGGKEDGPSIKFHEESGLLMVRGAEDEIRVVEEVITSIERGLTDQRKSSDVIKALQAENDRLRMEIDVLKQKLETLLRPEKASPPRDEKQSR